MRLFTKEQEITFELVWVHANIHGDYQIEKDQSDDEYIDYHIWEDINFDYMCKTYMQNTRVIRGSNPNIIFHGGCLGCLSQRSHGVSRCKGCKYFKGDWSEPDLSISGEDSATISGNNLKRFLS